MQTAPMTQPLHATLGAAAAVLSAMFIIGFIDNFVPRIAETHGLWQFHFIRAVMAVALMVAFAWATGRTLRPVSLRAVALRNLFISLAMLIYFGCLAFLPIAEVAAGLFTSPIFVLVLSAVFYGAPVGPWRLVAVVIGFSGILLVLRPEVGAMNPVSFVPVIGGLFHACAGVVTRYHCRDEPVIPMLIWFFAFLGLWGALGLGALALLAPEVPAGTAGFVLRGWETPTAGFLFWTTVQCVGSIVAVGLLIRGYQLAEAAMASVFEYALLAFAALWGWILWGQTVDAYAMAGMAAITVAGGLIAYGGRLGGAARTAA